MSEIVRLEGQVIVKPGKNIVASVVPELKDEFRLLLEEAPGRIVMDLTGVEMIDSPGLGILIAAYNSLSKRGGSLTLTNLSSDIRSLLKAMRLDKHFRIEE